MDTGFHDKGKVATIGFFFRNRLGQQRSGHSPYYQHCNLHMLMSNDFDNVIFESDAQDVSSNYVCVLKFSMLISSIKNLLVLCPNFKVKFVR
jgi:hypothetical protein